MKKNSWKHVLQLGVIALIAGFILKVFFGGAPANVESYCPFGGLESLATYLNTETLACSMSVKLRWVSCSPYVSYYSAGFSAVMSAR